MVDFDKGSHTLPLIVSCIALRHTVLFIILPLKLLYRLLLPNLILIPFLQYSPKLIRFLLSIDCGAHPF